MPVKLGYFVAGLGGGVLVAGGVFAFINAIGVISRLAAISKTAKHIRFYEDMVAIGGTVGNIIYVFCPAFSPHIVLLAVFSIFAGIYTGCIAMALAEVINIIPITAARLKLKFGFGFVIFSFAAGKFTGALFQLLKG